MLDGDLPTTVRSGSCPNIRSRPKEGPGFDGSLGQLSIEELSIQSQSVAVRIEDIIALGRAKTAPCRNEFGDWLVSSFPAFVQNPDSV